MRKKVTERGDNVRRRVPGARQVKNKEQIEALRKELAEAKNIVSLKKVIGQILDIVEK